jgi:hypothetical protein
VRELPFISLPNLNQIRKATETSGDSSTIKETNIAAELLYETIEISGKEAIMILRD